MQTREFLAFFTRIIVIIATIAAVVGAISGAMFYIDRRISVALNDPEMLRKIALATRPQMIIDSRGSVVADFGAMEYLADFRVTGQPNVADTIVFTPRRYMAQPPLVTSIGDSFFTVTSERGQKLDWVVHLKYSMSNEDAPNRYRVEIIER
jgi:hypothetical protein